MRIELAVLDMDGTTVSDDGVIVRAMQAALSGQGVHSTDAEVEAWLGYGAPLALRALLTLTRKVPPSADEVETAHGSFRETLLEHCTHAPCTRAIPGATETFRHLRERGVRVALNTALDSGLARVILKRLDWRVGRDIDAVIATDEVSRGRPHSDMIRALMARLGVRSASRVVKVGDTAADCLEGRAAGCGLVVGVLSGGTTRAKLLADGAHEVLRTVAELPELRWDPPFETVLHAS